MPRRHTDWLYTHRHVPVDTLDYFTHSLRWMRHFRLHLRYIYYIRTFTKGLRCHSILSPIKSTMRGKERLKCLCQWQMVDWNVVHYRYIRFNCVADHSDDGDENEFPKRDSTWMYQKGVYIQVFARLVGHCRLMAHNEIISGQTSSFSIVYVLTGNEREL